MKGRLKFDGQAMRLLRWLRENPMSSSLEITDALRVPNTTARISELRQAGYTIECRRDGRGVRRYLVVEPKPIDRGETVGMGGMMSRPEFGRDRLPPSVAEDAPAWPPLKTLAVAPVSEFGKQDEGLSQVEFGDGIWHRFAHIKGEAYVARCGAKAGLGGVRSRIHGQPTCRERWCVAVVPE